MFIWRGWGVLVLFIVFLVSLIANFAANIFGGNGYWNTHAWPLASALIIAGGLIWMTDLYFFRRPGKVLVDEKTGEMWKASCDSKGVLDRLVAIPKVGANR